ncbi:head assembly [Synechococcus phage S-CBP2]|uniref:Capsid assembly protein (Scaffold) n=1 Tax=Synechococcus phage S-CBP2 TaxID=756277 RepID=A0A096VKZ8_9CAUD|nr:head assembly [Synechococcus phage S-CBP2]AGF91084.1 hypothetical protein SXHG_00062 [Synechococcus phage MRHenn-2013a]AGK86739.1 capsid assembly protein (scaffold) [Synechococcus phage S-CBP2]
MAINNTFDASDGADTSDREAAEARALEAGNRIVEAQEEARQERYTKASQVDETDARFAGKYKSAEELEKAYLELQRKLGERPADEDEGDAEEAVEGQEEASEEEDDEEGGDEPSEVLQALEAASREFDEGGISKETLDSLAQLDSRTLVETWAEYISAQKEQVAQAQLNQEQTNQIYQAVGGQEAYAEMVGWASENLSPDEIAAYDAVVNGGDYNATYWAVQGLRSRFADSVGVEGKVYSGARAPKPADGFRSQAELARAIADPRYRDDPAYRIDVQEKLARSGNLL